VTESAAATRKGWDTWAPGYDQALAKGLALAGEPKEYFARRRVEFLAACLKALGESPRTAMDFGCGTGSNTPYLLELLGGGSLIGLDISPQSLDIARNTYGSPAVRFLLCDEWQGCEDIDLVHCNGVFHHIRPADRPAAIERISGALRKGGILSFWENNPWNPGTVAVMKRVPFDRYAVPVYPPQAARLLRATRFRLLRTDFLFVFPRSLSRLRRIEPLLSRFPLGAQYQIVCRK